MHCYPLHPIALLALPELCGQLGQHGRTLFSFLASAEPNTARSFLEATAVPKPQQALPVITISDLFDFFAGAGQAMALSIGGSRWREIHERVREAANLDDGDLAVLKAVGLLNLMGNALGLRASADLVAFALSDPAAPADAQWRARLEDLEARGFLTFRSFADEYRLWQGSDVDLRGRVSDAREQLRSTNAADLLGRLQSDNPIIAARHSQEVGMLRYFAVSYTDDGSKASPEPAQERPGGWPRRLSPRIRRDCSQSEGWHGPSSDRAGDIARVRDGYATRPLRWPPPWRSSTSRRSWMTASRVASCRTASPTLATDSPRPWPRRTDPVPRAWRSESSRARAGASQCPGTTVSRACSRTCATTRTSRAPRSATRCSAAVTSPAREPRRAAS